MKFKTYMIIISLFSLILINFPINGFAFEEFAKEQIEEAKQLRKQIKTFVPSSFSKQCGLDSVFKKVKSSASSVFEVEQIFLIWIQNFLHEQNKFEYR